MRPETGADTLVGRTVGGYRIDSFLGRGGMGSVFRAHQITLNRTVALKVIAPELAADEGFRLRFRRESEVAASLEHPHVVPIHEAGEADGLLYISMRFVEGTDLREAIRASGALAPEQAAAIVSQVGSALDAAHGRGLVHRDVKPANILLDRSDPPRAYLTDFGVVKQIGGATTSGLTATGQMVGTVSYVAPEQLQGLEGVDGRADVYSLGCVLYETLTGITPFGQRSPVALMYAHLHEAPPLPSAQQPGLAPGFDACVNIALQKDPDRRYSSAGALAEAALAAAAGRDTPAPAQAPGAATQAFVVPIGESGAATHPLPAQDGGADAATRALAAPAPAPSTVGAPPAGPPAGPPAAGAPPRRRSPLLPIGAALLALAAVAAIVVVLASGGDDSGSGGSGSGSGGSAAGQPAADRTPPRVVDTIDLGAPVTAIGHGRSIPPTRQAFFGTDAGEVIRVDTANRRRHTVADVGAPVRQVTWGTSQRTLWVRTRSGSTSSGTRLLFVVNPYRSDAMRQVKIEDVVFVVARPDGTAAAVREGSDGLSVAWVGRDGKVAADRPLPIGASDARFATSGAELFVADPEGNRLVALPLAGPSAPAPSKPDGTAQLPGSPLHLEYGGVPQRLWALIETSDGERSVVAVDADGMKLDGSPIALPFSDDIANGGTTIYYYRTGPGVESPSLGQIDTERHTPIRPRLRIPDGIGEVDTSAGYLWVAGVPGTSVTRLK
jgi:hypothetical protein